MKLHIAVNSGEVKTGRLETVLRANAIGSCVVVAAYEACARVGGMAHVMLPGRSPDQMPWKKTRYAENAVEEMMRKVVALGAKPVRVESCLVGGANVLGEGRESPGPASVRSLGDILAAAGIAVVATEVGGRQRRSCTLDVARGRVTYTLGDSGQRLLWEATRPLPGRTPEGMSGDGKGERA
jgi:chemotaxis protein CheD